MMSIPRPTTLPFTAAMTGKGQRSGAVMACWMERMRVRVWRAQRAGSSVGRVFVPSWDRLWTASAND